MKRTGEEFKEKAKNLRGVKIITRDCVLCGYSLGIIIDGENIFFDSGCNCIEHKDMQPILWENFADYYNNFTNQENKDAVDMIFGLK